MKLKKIKVVQKRFYSVKIKSPNHSNRAVRHFGHRRLDTGRRRLRDADDSGAILVHRPRRYHDTVDRTLANCFGLDHLGIHGLRQFSGSFWNSRNWFRCSSIRRDSPLQRHRPPHRPGRRHRRRRRRSPSCGCYPLSTKPKYKYKKYVECLRY